MAAPLGNQFARGHGRKGYGLEQREKRLREQAMALAEDILKEFGKDGKITQVQFEILQTVLKRALKQRTELTGKDDGPIQVQPILGGLTKKE